MRLLDQRLYAWLAEPDEQRFERAFNAYFAVAFPAVVRHLARMSRWDTAQLEDLAQEALLKFFQRAGRGRREASELIAATLPHLHALALGPIHERQLKGWKGDIASFRDSVMGFSIAPNDEADDATWKSTIRILADRIPRLQRQGGHLVEAVRLKLEWNIAELTPGDPASTAVSTAAPLDDNDSVLALVQGLCEQLAQKGQQSLAAQAKLSGVQLFCVNARTVIVSLPPLRIPTSGFMFEIALSLYLDECKRRGRRKRGGTAMSHPIESMNLEPDVTPDGDSYLDGAEFAATAGPTSDASFLPSHDPTQGYENEDFLERFYQHLREPLDRATAQYEVAGSPGRAAAERRKVATLTQKFTRTIAVLSNMGEGYTQEQTAGRLAISRNQVKYIVELVQEAYLRFAEAPRTSPMSLAAQGDVAHGR